MPLRWIEETVVAIMSHSLRDMTWDSADRLLTLLNQVDVTASFSVPGMSLVIGVFITISRNSYNFANKSKGEFIIASIQSSKHFTFNFLADLFSRTPS